VSIPDTWHHGLVAEWWAHFNTEGPEIEYLGARVADAQPVLDAGCGTGRLLVPWIRAGLDVDGCDASTDMIRLCRDRARREGHDPTLFVQALHELDPPRRYGAIVVCGVFGLGSTRAQDQEALSRLLRSLEPDGVLFLDNEVPYANERMWARWTKTERDALPTDWSDDDEWRRAPDGAEFLLTSRVLSVDPLDQCVQLAIRAEKREHGEARIEHWQLSMRLYFRDELVLMLERAGFGSVRVEGAYTGREPTPDDHSLLFIASR
jgi:SAM-dependent methyltransferase